MIVSPLFPAIRAQFGQSSHIGFLFTGYSWTAGLSVLVWGPLSDKFGRKSGLLTGLIIFGVGSSVSCLAAGFSILLAGRILTGTGASMLSLNAISYAADYFPYDRRGWAMGAIFSSYFAALILALPLGVWMGGKFGWNAVFGTMGGAAILLLVTIGWGIPFSPKKDRGSFKFQKIEYLRQYKSFLKGRSSMFALLSSLFASAGTMGFIAFLVVWLDDSFHISGGRVSLVFMICGAAALLASPVAGSIADRIGKRLQFILSCVSLAVFLFILPGLRWGPALFAVFGLISLSAAFRQGPMEAILTEIVHSSSRGAFVALKNSFSQLGIGLAAFFSDFLFKHYGYAGVCILGAISNLLAAGFMLFTLREKRL
jgi:predicted MFS family arabinose efflux permease